MKKAGIIGHFGFGHNLLNGQTIKTKIITEEIVVQFGPENVMLLDLAGGIKRIPSLLIAVPKVLCKCENFIMMPVENGLRFLTPLLCFWNLFFKRKLHYVVIGGWLPRFLAQQKKIQRGLKKFDGIYVETNTMKKALEAQEFRNVFVMPNCKKLTVLSKEELVYPSGAPYKLCTFSRVMKEKGIETAIKVIERVNQKCGYTAYALDIYGQVWEDSKDWFEKLQSQFPEYVRYCGCVDADQSVQVLKGYFALLFPTHFYTEGIPGTIIDAYAAGLPVISAKWESFADVIDEGITGFGYDFDDEKRFEDILFRVAQTPQMLLDMKEVCVRKAKDYIPQAAVQILIHQTEDG